MSNETDFGGLGVCHKLSIIHHPIPFMSMAPSVGCKPVLSLRHQAMWTTLHYSITELFYSCQLSLKSAQTGSACIHARMSLMCRLFCHDGTILHASL